MVDLSSFPEPFAACVFGASGGIGAALVQTLAASPRVSQVHARSRRAANPAGNIVPFTFDLLDENSIAQAAASLKTDSPIRLIILATGVLHDGRDLQPEKNYRAQSPDAYARAFAINATGPALVAKHFLPLLPRTGKSVFAVLSARVSSIEDNRLGGWHAYRASKAALNMIMRNLAIELSRSHPDAVALTLHPGTVETNLSAPFARNVASGQLFTPDHSASCLIDVIDKAVPADSGSLIAWDGQKIPF